MELDALAFDFAPVGLVMLENRIIRRCNKAFGEMFQEQPVKCEGGLAAMRETGRYNDERVMRRRDGTLFWCRVRGQSLTPDSPFQRGIWSFADLSDDRPIVELTQREREVAILTCRGLTSKEVGLELNLSYRTVEEYRARLLRKFGARKLAELVAKLSGMPL